MLTSNLWLHVVWYRQTAGLKLHTDKQAHRPWTIRSCHLTWSWSWSMNHLTEPYPSPDHYNVPSATWVYWVRVQAKHPLWRTTFFFPRYQVYMIAIAGHMVQIPPISFVSNVEQFIVTCPRWLHHTDIISSSNLPWWRRITKSVSSRLNLSNLMPHPQQQ